MVKIKKTLKACMLLLFLGGCASTPEDYMQKSEYSLCLDYLTMGGNIHQENRYIAIKRLGYDCSKYIEEAKAKKKADDKFYESLKGVMDATIDCSVKKCM